MIRVGIIGCGTIARVRHVPEYANNPAVEIAGYFDMMPQAAEALAKKYGGKVYESVEALVADETIDAVSVCTANVTHAEIAIKALNAGKHVLCEKPMATTLEQCIDMVEAARKSGKKLMIGQNQRFAPAHAKARELIEAGEIGQLLTFETSFGHSGPENWCGKKNPWFFDKTRSVFGAMADLGVHKTDLLQYLMGEPIVKVSAILGTRDKKYPDGNLINVDDNAFCLYQSKSGIFGTMHASWTEYGEENNYTILQGTKGVIRCYTDPKYTLIVEKPGHENTRYELGTVGNNEEVTGGKVENSGVIDAFISSIVNDTVPPIDGEDALKVMRVIFAALESSETGRTIEIPENRI